MSKSFAVSTEINLLGKTVDEALAELDKYLDDAYLAHLPSVRIVHGKGTGALRNAVQNHLRRVKYVKSFRLGEFGEGDAGVTIADNCLSHTYYISVFRIKTTFIYCLYNCSCHDFYQIIPPTNNRSTKSH